MWVICLDTKWNSFDILLRIFILELISGFVVSKNLVILPTYVSLHCTILFTELSFVFKYLDFVR